MSHRISVQKPQFTLCRIILGSLLTLALGLSARAAEPVVREWTVDGVKREATVCVPDTAKTQATPVIFVFHGHGGSMQLISRSIPMHTLMPEALVVYMQGLNTPGQLVDSHGDKPGWQNKPGMLGDRDLKFFDAVLASLQQDYKIDTKRIFGVGHSNGGTFCYVLWAERGDAFAGFAISSSVAERLVPKFKPKTVLVMAGVSDQLVRFVWQQSMIGALQKLNGCTASEPWEKDCTRYFSNDKPPIIAFLHGGGHTFPPESSSLIATFIRESSDSIGSSAKQ